MIVTIFAGMYGNAILGGVMGDYLGATIAVAELAVYSTLSAKFDQISSIEASMPLIVVAVVAVIPVWYCRRIVNFPSTC